MAEQKKKFNPSVGFYSEPGFVSLTTSLRKLSGDDTIPTDKYVDINKDLYDLITPDEPVISGGIVDINLGKDKKSLIISYANDSHKTLTIDDNYIFQVYYDNILKLIYFVLKNGAKLTLDVNFLYEQFATKKEVEIVQEEIDEIQKDITNIENTLVEIEENVTNIIEKGVDVKWIYF